MTQLNCTLIENSIEYTKIYLKYTLFKINIQEY